MFSGTDVTGRSGCETTTAVKRRLEPSAAVSRVEHVSRAIRDFPDALSYASPGAVRRQCPRDRSLQVLMYEAQVSLRLAPRLACFPVRLESHSLFCWAGCSISDTRPPYRFYSYKRPRVTIFAQLNIRAGVSVSILGTVKFLPLTSTPVPLSRTRNDNRVEIANLERASLIETLGHWRESVEERREWNRSPFVIQLCPF